MKIWKNLCTHANLITKQIRLKKWCKCQPSFMATQGGILCVINQRDTTATQKCELRLATRSSVRAAGYLVKENNWNIPVEAFSLEILHPNSWGMRSSPEEGCYLLRACFLLMKELVPQEFLLVSTVFRSSSEIINGIFSCTWKVWFVCSTNKDGKISSRMGLFVEYG